MMTILSTTIILRQQARYGFSLIELSLVMLIMSVVMGATLSIATDRIREEHIKQTELHLAKTAEALAAYAEQYRRIPCPADSSLPLDNGNFGVESEDCLIDVGMIPTKTLQIADDYAFDGWGRRIIYHMASPCSITTNFNDDDLCPSGSGITINSPAIDTPRTTKAIFALVSYGENGFGAISHNGETRIGTTTASVEELENINGDTIYLQRSTTSDFDDIVLYNTRSLLIQKAGGLVGMGNNAAPPINVSPLCAMMTSRVFSNASAKTMCGADNTECSDALWSENDTGVAAQISNLCF